MYYIEDKQGRRTLPEEAFPLTLGGPDGFWQMAEPGRKPRAFLGIDRGRVFLQPAPGFSLRRDKKEITTSQWLRAGDCFSWPDGSLRIQDQPAGLCFRWQEAALVLTPPTEDPPLEPPPAEDPPLEAPAVEETAEKDNQPEVADAPIPIAMPPATRKRIKNPLIFLVIALLITMTAFVFMATTVQIAVSPPPDTVSFKGPFVMPKIGSRYLVWPGTYRLIAEKAGYETLNVVKRIRRKTSLNYRLTKLAGHLKLSGPPGTQIFIDGTEYGNLPLETIQLNEGRYQLRAVAERNKPFSREFQIEGGGKEQELVIQLASDVALIEFDSLPAGAQVRTGGRILGKTPFQAELSEGAHDFHLILKGFKPFRSRLKVKAEQNQKLPRIDLIPSDGNLVVTTTPDGALVALNGIYAGTTPLQLRLRPDRQNTLNITKTGYQPRLEKVVLAADEARELDWPLEPETSRLRLSLWPPEARLLINGTPRPTTADPLVLAATSSRIRAMAEGYHPFEVSMAFLPGMTHELKITLKTMEQAKKDAVQENLQDGQGHRLRLIKPHPIQLGASRRQPGRRANEVLRKVDLIRPFYMADREVSNAQFLRFKPAHSSDAVRGHRLDQATHPVVRIRWEDAVAYCNWLSETEKLPHFYEKQGDAWVPADPLNHGYRLPTEAEWTFAARYPDRKTPGKYPWGDKLPVAAGSGNFADAAASGLLPATITNYKDNFATTAPGAGFPANPLGIYDLGGNVAEWVHDFYEIATAVPELKRDPFGPPSGSFHVIRGSSWMHSTITELRFSFRDYGVKPRPDVGFRIARYLE